MNPSKRDHSGEGDIAWSTDSTGLRGMVALLLVISLGCNLAALRIPFLSLREGLSSEPYTLLTSVKMLWSAKLFILAFLVTAFSVCFPFAKLAVLGWVVVKKQPGAWWLGKQLGRVEQLGKWSLLDAFLVCLVMGLTSGQMLVGAEPLVGLTLFATAIILSMVSGELLAHALLDPSDEVPPENALAKTWGAVVLLFSGGALTLALFMPFLQIDDWLLANHRYSIASLVVSLAEEGALTSSLLAGTFLILTPLASWVGSVCLWFSIRSASSRRGGGWSRGLRILRRWTMLDVFCLALGIFLLEGDYLMDTKVRSGAGFLVVVVVVQLGFQWLGEHQMIGKRISKHSNPGL